MIRLQNLSIGYKNHCVQQNLTLSLPPHRLTCLLGSNGVGKSTLLRTICGFIPPLLGSLLLQGTDIHALTRVQRSRLVAAVLTDKLDEVNLTVRELVSLGRTPYTGFWGKLSAVDAAQVDQALALVGISALATRRLHTLSDGERQKAMIAKALAQQTPLIILDEPTAFLDFPSKVDTMRLLSRLAHTQQKTIFLSTHDVELAFQTADHLWIMDKVGIAEGTPSQLAQDGSIARFLASSDILFSPEDLTLRIRPEL